MCYRTNRNDVKIEIELNVESKWDKICLWRFEYKTSTLWPLASNSNCIRDHIQYEMRKSFFFRCNQLTENQFENEYLIGRCCFAFEKISHDLFHHSVLSPKISRISSRTVDLRSLKRYEFFLSIPNLPLLLFVRFERKWIRTLIKTKYKFDSYDDDDDDDNNIRRTIVWNLLTTFLYDTITIITTTNGYW